MEGDDAAGLSDVNDYEPVENIRRLLDGRDSRKDLIRFKTADRPPQPEVNVVLPSP